MLGKSAGTTGHGRVLRGDPARNTHLRIAVAIASALKMTHCLFARSPGRWYSSNIISGKYRSEGNRGPESFTEAEGHDAIYSCRR